MTELLFLFELLVIAAEAEDEGVDVVDAADGTMPRDDEPAALPLTLT